MNSINEILKKLKVKDTKQVNSNYPTATIKYTKDMFIVLLGDREGNNNKNCECFTIEMYGETKVRGLDISRRDILGKKYCNYQYTCTGVVIILNRLLGRIK